MSASPSPPTDRSSPPSPGPIRPFHLPEVHPGVLQTGLRLRSMTRDGVPLMSACLVLDAGEAGVPPGREGVAVLTGDALQGGTARRPGVELAEALERTGSRLRVSTGWDGTTVAFTASVDRADEILALLAEVIREPAFPEDEVERIRRQRLAAIRQRRMEPDLLADDELDREVFSGDHPYHRPLSGTAESVGALGRDDVVAFAREHYSPVRGGFAAAGDLGSRRVEALAERHFHSWAPPYAGRRELPTPRKRTAPSLVVVDRPGAVQSEIRIGHAAPSRGHPEEAAMRIVNTILGGAFSSRLNLQLREERGFTYGVRSRFAFRRTGGAFTIGTAVQTEVTAAALGEAMEVFRRFAEEGPTDEELDRARDYLAGVFPLRMETTAQLAARLAELLIFDLPHDYYHGYRDRIRGVELDGARAAARNHLLPDRAAAVVVGDADRIRGELASLGLAPVEVRQP